MSAHPESGGGGPAAEAANFVFMIAFFGAAGEFLDDELPTMMDKPGHASHSGH